MALQTHVSALNSSKCFPPSTANPPSKIFVHDFFASPSNIVKHSAKSLQASRRLQPCLASNNNQEAYRPLANFAPSIWKDPNIFTSEIPQLEIESNDKLAEELKQQVKEMLIASASDPAEKVCFIDSICRLGVSYHFETEIEEQLNQIFEAQPNLAEDNDYDLYTIALLFRVFRQHGFKMSCGVFDKFKDSNGTFKENLAGDARGMLSLYEATHLRVRGEDILEEALDFTTTNLKSLAKSSPDHLAKHITSALEAPLHKNVPRLETHKYISFYQEDLGEYRNETLLIFAKLDFNRVQLLHQQELKHVTRWWKDNKFASKFSYSRDRIVEMYFWTTANYFEPRYSRARIVQTKLMMILTITDDTYDAYGTLEELQSFTDALERWDTHATGDLPDYMKTLYSVILNLFDELNNDVSEEGRSYSVSITKDKLKEYVRACLEEAKWFNEGFVPSFNQRLSNAIITAGTGFVIAASFVGMGETARINEFEWLQNHPKIVEAVFTIGRLKGDIKAHEFEQKRGHVSSTVGCYMKQYGISKEETVEKFEKILIANAWKDINEEYMKQTDVSRNILVTVVNFARLAEILYKNQDGFTFPEDLKDYIIKLFVDPIPV
ncbi:probable terpene synthase 6 [Pistacia vera]|uniref:probable terpene synthase 6 n=1 Tax=Pistacia vera TaxID=55513 RepID=UPI0012631429|nr:probable terpene synthase 6 [Pistacia vera]